MCKSRELDIEIISPDQSFVEEEVALKEWQQKIFECQQEWKRQTQQPYETDLIRDVSARGIIIVIYRALTFILYHTPSNI